MPVADLHLFGQGDIMDRDRDAEEDDAPAPKVDIRAKLKHVAHYAMLGFAPVVSILALGVALFATGNHSDPTQLNNLKSKIEILNLSLLASKTELEDIKFSRVREKSQRVEERKKSEEIDATIIQNITRLQERLKISPTLEEQLRAAAKAAAVVSPVGIPASAAASAPVVSDKLQTAPAPAGSEKKSAAVSVPKETVLKSVPKEVAQKTVSEKIVKKPVSKEPAKKPAPKPIQKLSPQVKAIKDAIDEYNKQ
jgi:hypothetical protein